DHYVGVYELVGIFGSLIVEPTNSNDIQILCTNLGAYAKELMHTCVDIVLDNNEVSMTNPVELMCRGVKETSMSVSSNFLIANFHGQEAIKSKGGRSADCFHLGWPMRKDTNFFCQQEAANLTTISELQTHAAMEPFILSAHRKLSTMHSIYKLLDPHMRYTPEINDIACQNLLNADGVIELLQNCSAMPGNGVREIFSEMDILSTLKFHL
ncbi:linoleate 13S-lipoxygenase 3-1, chloroplastic-like protein, partial [Tanacetum coccineum]